MVAVSINGSPSATPEPSAATGDAVVDAEAEAEPVVAQAPACPEGMVHIPKATFMMGSAGNTGSMHEYPQRQVHLSAYCMDCTEVTTAAYQRCVREASCSSADQASTRGIATGACNAGRYDRREHPINCVDWGQAAAFCRWLGGSLPHGLPLRAPSGPKAEALIGRSASSLSADEV